MKKLEFKTKLLVYLGLLAILGALVMEPAFAGESKGGGLPYEGWLTAFSDSMTGPVAFTLSLLGIIGAGGMLIFGGDLSGFMRTMVFIVLVTSMLIGAKTLLQKITGSGALVGHAVVQQINSNNELVPVTRVQNAGDVYAENTSKTYRK